MDILETSVQPLSLQLCVGKRFCIVFYIALHNLWLRIVHTSTYLLLIAHSGRPHTLCFKTVMLIFLGKKVILAMTCGHSGANCATAVTTAISSKPLICIMSHYKTCGTVASTCPPTKSWLLIQVVQTISVLKHFCWSFWAYISAVYVLRTFWSQLCNSCHCSYVQLSVNLFYVALQNPWLRNAHRSAYQLLTAHSGHPHILWFKRVPLVFLGTNNTWYDLWTFWRQLCNHCHYTYV